MGDISFETLYQKSLLIKKNDLIEEEVKYKLNQEQQIEYLKELSKIKFKKNDSLINIYSKDLNAFRMVLYMVKVPKINNSVDTNISVYLEYYYRTAVLLIKQNKKECSIIDNIFAFQSKKMKLVEEKYNSLHKQFSIQSDEEIIYIINNYIEEEISKNK